MFSRHSSLVKVKELKGFFYLYAHLLETADYEKIEKKKA
jgi:hypothetical protein